jgi:hypothetical protein
MHARGDGLSHEIETLGLIDRFGVEAILGRRQLYFGEVRRMRRAENIVNAYHARKNSDTWAKWASQNPEMEKILIEAEILCH